MTNVAQSARMFRTRFLAASMHLRTLTDDRATQSAQQAAALKAILAGHEIVKEEVVALQELVMKNNEAWRQEDVLALVKDLENAIRKRRREQQWCEQLTGIFTEEEWIRLKGLGLDDTEEILMQIICRIRALGGTNLCEYTKKRLTAIWLHLRGDGNTSSRTDRNVAQLHVKNKLARALRNFEPDVYNEILDLTKVSPNVFGGKLPVKVPGADIDRIMYIDSMMNCRGTGTETTVCAQIPPATQALQSEQPQLNANMLFGILSQFMNNGMGEQRITINDGKVPGGMKCTRNREARSHFSPQPPRQPEFAALGDVHDCDGDGVDARDSLDAVSNKMMSRKPKVGKAESDQDASDEPSDDGDDEPLPKKKKSKKAAPKKAASVTPTKKDKTKKDASPVKPTKKAPKLKVKKMPAGYAREPSIGWERSRDQVQCRSGKIGPNSCLAIKFADNGGSKGAWKKAEAWLSDAMREYKRKCK